jgi:hypothetical protein
MPPDFEETLNTMFQECNPYKYGDRNQSLFISRVRDTKTLQALGDEIGVTRERVRSICHSYIEFFAITANYQRLMLGQAEFDRRVLSKDIPCSINELNITKRAYKALVSAGIKNTSDIFALKDFQHLVAIPKVGISSAESIVAALKQYGFDVSCFEVPLYKKLTLNKLIRDMMYDCIPIQLYGERGENLGQYHSKEAIPHSLKKQEVLFIRPDWTRQIMTLTLRAC